MPSLDVNKVTVTRNASTGVGVLAHIRNRGWELQRFSRTIQGGDQRRRHVRCPEQRYQEPQPDFSATREDIYSKRNPRGGFAYQKDNRSLQKYEAYGRVDPDSKDCFFNNGYICVQAVIAEANDDSMESLTKSFFLVIDAAAQALLVGPGRVVAPAKLTVTIHLPLKCWLQRLKDNRAKVKVHAKHDSLQPSRFDGKATYALTTRHHTTPLCTVFLVANHPSGYRIPNLSSVLASRTVTLSCLLPNFWGNIPGL